MRKEFALIILLLTGSLVLEEMHQLFRNYPTTKIHLFPFHNSVISVQWYVYDLCNCISAVLIALAFVYALRIVSKNMKDICLVYLLYRVVELIMFLLWNKQQGYFWLILCIALLFYLIITKWRKV